LNLCDILVELQKYHEDLIHYRIVKKGSPKDLELKAIIRNLREWEP
jgi:hypothetical protein